MLLLVPHCLGPVFASGLQHAGYAAVLGLENAEAVKKLLPPAAPPEQQVLSGDR